MSVRRRAVLMFIKFTGTTRWQSREHSVFLASFAQDLGYSDLSGLLRLGYSDLLLDHPIR